MFRRREVHPVHVETSPQDAMRRRNVYRMIIAADDDEEVMLWFGELHAEAMSLNPKDDAMSEPARYAAHLALLHSMSTCPRKPEEDPEAFDLFVRAARRILAAHGYGGGR